MGKIKIYTTSYYISPTGGVWARPGRERDALQYAWAIKMKRGLQWERSVLVRFKEHDDLTLHKGASLEDNQRMALRAFYLYSKPLWGELTGKEPACLVPIPPAEATSSSYTGRFPALDMAQMLVEHSDGAFTSVEDVLRWNEEFASSYDGGDKRSTNVLFEHVRVTGTRPPPKRCVLIDDVCTLGSHIVACASRLSQHGWKPVSAVVAGATVLDHPAKAFQSELFIEPALLKPEPFISF